MNNEVNTKKRNIKQKLQQARVDLKNTPLAKSGTNQYFKYYELKDFIPTVIDIFNNVGLCSTFSIACGTATLTILDTDSDDSLTFSSPVAEVTLRGGQAIQAIGAQHTYMRRYLYLNALDIVENDIIEASHTIEEPEKGQKVYFNDLKKRITSQKTSDSLRQLIETEKYKIQKELTLAEQNEIRYMVTSQKSKFTPPIYVNN